MKKLTAFLLSAMVLLTSCTQATPQATVPLPMEEYLKTNTVTAKEENIEEIFSLLDTKSYDLYFTGEEHGLRNTYVFKLELLKYLHKNAGVRYFLEENGFAAVQYLNLYLKTGDESILNNYISDTNGTGGYSQEYYDFYKEIYAFNQTLPQEDRITVIGLDIEHLFSTPIRYLQEFLPTTPPPLELESTIQYLKEFDQFVTLADDPVSRTMNMKREVMQRIVEPFYQYTESYKTYLGEKYEEYAFIMDCLESTYQANLMKSYNRLFVTAREKQIYKVFTSIYPTLKTKKVYGHWGGGHTQLMKGMWNHIPGRNSFLKEAIDQEEIDGEKVCVIDLVAIDSHQLISGNYTTKLAIDTGTGLLPEEDLEMIERFVTEDYGIIKLDGKGSPFATSKAWARERGHQVNGDSTVTTDSYSYIYVLKNSPAATKYVPKTTN